MYQTHNNPSSIREHEETTQSAQVLEPLPLHRPLIAPTPYPIDALGGILAPATKALQRVMRASDAICAQSILGAAALACQPFANIEVDGRETPLSLFLITVAESGERKSATDKVALKPLYDWQKMLSDVYRSDFTNYRSKHDLWEAQKKVFLKDITQSSKVFNLPEPIPPLEPLTLVDEPTYEGVVKLLLVGQPSLGIFSDEGGRFFGGHAMNRENQIKTISGLSSLWDGKPVNRSRAGDGSVVLYGKRVSLHLMIQEIILEQLMGNKGIEHQGFLPRCLLAYPASTAGSRTYVEEDISQDSAIISYWQKINELLDRKFPVDPPPALQNELKPRLLRLSIDAKQAWIQYHNAIDRDLIQGGRLESVRRFANKAAEHVLRLAGVLAMIDDPEVDVVEKTSIEKGISLVEYYLGEILRIQGCLLIPNNLLLAQKVLNWCWSKEKDEVTLQQLYQNGPNEIRQARTARDVMLTLEEHGWAIPAAGHNTANSKHKNVWNIRKKAA